MSVVVVVVVVATAVQMFSYVFECMALFQDRESFSLPKKRGREMGKREKNGNREKRSKKSAGGLPLWRCW